MNIQFQSENRDCFTHSQFVNLNGVFEWIQRGVYFRTSLNRVKGDAFAVSAISCMLAVPSGDCCYGNKYQYIIFRYLPYTKYPQIHINNMSRIIS